MLSEVLKFDEKSEQSLDRIRRLNTIMILFLLQLSFPDELLLVFLSTINKMSGRCVPGLTDVRRSQVRLYPNAERTRIL